MIICSAVDVVRKAGVIRIATGGSHVGGLLGTMSVARRENDGFVSNPDRHSELMIVVGRSRSRNLHMITAASR